MMTSADMEKQTMKASKPAMEKRRRARINESLQQLKALVLDGLNKNNSRHSKLEKADILEMTVRYLRNVQRQQVKASVETDPAVITQYRTGFAECMGEVSRYLGGAIDENPEVRARLLGHLAGLCTTTQQHHPHQPIKYAVVGHGQMPSPPASHVQPSLPAPAASCASSSRASSSRGLVAMNSAASPAVTTAPPSSVHCQPQVMQVSFPTPPVSGGCRLTYPSTLMTSPPPEGTRNGCVSQILSPQPPQVQSQQLPVMKGPSDAPPSPRYEAPAPRGTQPVMLAQGLPNGTVQQVTQPTGDMITLILPSQSLPGGQMPTHLIPVYAQEAGKVVSPPIGFSFTNKSSSTSLSAGNGTDNNPTACAVSTPSPKAASTAPATVVTGQPAAWTAIPLPTAQLVSPQRAGAVVPSAMTSPFALSIPFNAKISPPGLAIQAEQPTEQAGRPIRPPGLFLANNEGPGVNDPMWRPW